MDHRVLCPSHVWLHPPGPRARGTVEGDLPNGHPRSFLTFNVELHDSPASPFPLRSKPGSPIGRASGRRVEGGAMGDELRDGGTCWTP